VGRGAEGRPASSETDTITFMQYARAMSEGHPYRYSPGEAPSTGSTSHLYPAVLALLILSGAHGDALFTATFFLNAFFYLIWLQLFWLVARRVAPGQAILAAGLALLNGQLLMTASGLTDMALFAVLSWGLFAALLYERISLAVPLLILCVFARPEGMLLAVGLAGMGALLAWRHDPAARKTMGIAACGLAALCAVFALNEALTGFVQFQSVAQKGYLINFPILGALGCAARDFGTLVRELLFNANVAPRQSCFLPVAGGLLAITGLAGLFRVKNRTPLVSWWLGCALASLGLIALSEWQGLSTDRYFLWLLPTWYLLAACGAGQAAQMCRTPQLFPVLAVLLMGYELAAWPYFAARYGAACIQAQAVVNFAKSVDTLLPPQASVGVISGPSICYELGRHPVRHLAGITSPAFARQRDMLCAFEMLKHQPQWRFSHLVLTTSEEALCDTAGILGADLLLDLDAPPDGRIYTLCTARWDAYPSVALLPMDPSVAAAMAACKLVDSLDVGYMPDEHRCRYHIGSRLPDQIFRPCVATGTIGGKRIAEVGQPVIGWDEFRVHAASPGHTMHVVMRTTLNATCTVIRATERSAGEGLHLHSPIQLRPIVNGQKLPLVSLPLSVSPEAFSEGILDIPGAAITTDPVDIVLAGDHLALAYWFYQ